MSKKRRRSLDLEPLAEEERPARKRRLESFSESWDVPFKFYTKTDLCQPLHDAIRSFRDANNRLLCDHLIRAPNKRSVPEYYDRITHPIDLIKIQQKLRTEEYKSLPAFVGDVRLLVENAKKFYSENSVSRGLGAAAGGSHGTYLCIKEVMKNHGLQPSSDEYMRTIQLEEEFLKTLNSVLQGDLGCLVPPHSPKTVSLKLSKFQLTLPTTTTTSTQPSSSSAKPSTSATSKHLKLKGTRSKAWVSSYYASNDPIKMLLAAVYSYHDNNGEYVAQPFIGLPSKKDYPEYYQIITEPMCLNTIKSNVDNDRYANLRDVEDDLLLIIKNAHYFNEPGSEIYKLASTLRKFVINRCLELERRFHTVAKTQQLKSPTSPPTAMQKVPRLKVKVTDKGATCKTVRSQRSSVEESDSESSTDSSSSEEEVEEEDGADTGRSRLLLKIKTENFAIGRLLKMKSTPPLKKCLQTLYQTLITKTDREGRSVAELFRRKPSAKMYPEYYIVVSKPIDLKEISAKIKSEQYSSLDAMMADVNLLIENACFFNEEESQVYKDALVLKEVAQETYLQLKQILGESIDGPSSPPPQPPPPPSCNVATVQNDILALLVTIKNCTDAVGRKPWTNFRKLPPMIDVETIGKKPIGLQTISDKVDNREYSSVDALFNDLCQLFDSTCHTSPSHTQHYQDALLLHRVSVTKFAELTVEARAAVKRPDAQAEVQMILKGIMKRVRDYKDSNGRVLSTIISEVELIQEITDEDEDKLQRVLSLTKIAQWVDSGRYTRVEHLQTELLAVLTEAKRRGKEREEEGSGYLYGYALQLERQLLTTRDELCGGGLVLWSPALKQCTIRDLEKEEEEMIKRKEQAEAMEESVTSNPLLELPPPEEERVQCSEVEHNDVTYSIGEFVYLPARKQGDPNQIVWIEKLWRDSNGSEWLDGCWFAHPHETFHQASRKFYKREIFKTDVIMSVRLVHTLGKCCVLMIKDFIKYQPEEFSEEDVYVCESRYLHKYKSIKKIKSWSIPASQQPVLLPRPTTLTLTRVPSVFASHQSVPQPPQMDTEPSTEPESVSEHIENETTTSTSADSDKGDNSSLDLSFFDEAEDIAVSVNNPEDGATYYQQYSIDGNRFRLGDHVCVRSDQEKPFLARIDRIWTDKDNDPWFHGPWFVRMTEVQHLPTRMFYDCEVFMSNIRDTNPMRSIMRKCAILFTSDYLKLRPTDIPEEDVFVCESQYNEAEKSINRMKSLKSFQLSDEVVRSEILYLPHELHLYKNPSPQLFLKAQMASSTVPAPLPPAQSQPAAQSPALALSTSAGPLTLTLQQLQSLLAAQVGSGKAQVVPLGVQTQVPPPSSSPLRPPTPPVDSPSVTSTGLIPVFPCVWGNCTALFEDSTDLANHLLRSGPGTHINRDTDGNYYCYWANCPRHRELGGRPFDTFPKITRHVKEVHLLRVVPRQMPIDHLGSNFHRKNKGGLKMASPLTPSSSLSQSSSIGHLPPIRLVNPMVAANLSSQTVALPTLPQTIPTSIPIPSASLPKPTLSTTSAVAIAPTQQATSTVSAADTKTPPSIYHPPPPNQRRVVHSSIYLNYIERMRSNARYMTSLQPHKITPSLEQQASQWVDPSAVPEGMTMTQALMKLRDHMQTDSMKLSQWLELNK